MLPKLVRGAGGSKQRCAYHHSVIKENPILISCQCDGQHPMCSHCQGYGYACTWSGNETNRRPRSTDTPLHSPAAVTTDELRPSPSSKRRRYLGEASDVHFFHMIKRVLGDKPASDNAAENMQSYDQEEPTFDFENPNGHGGRLHLPSREIADKYIDIYFCTIHIAYPFICKQSFMVRYENFWKGNFEKGKGSPWISLLCKSSSHC